MNGRLLIELGDGKRSHTRTGLGVLPEFFWESSSSIQSPLPTHTAGVNAPSLICKIGSKGFRQCPA